MSALGEARAFRRAARRIRERLANEDLTPDERARLVEDLRWYDDEGEQCWGIAAAECGRGSDKPREIDDE